MGLVAEAHTRPLLYLVSSFLPLDEIWGMGF